MPIFKVDHPQYWSTSGWWLSNPSVWYAVTPLCGGYIETVVGSHPGSLYDTGPAWAGVGVYWNVVPVGNPADGLNPSGEIKMELETGAVVVGRYPLGGAE